MSQCRKHCLLNLSTDDAGLMTDKIRSWRASCWAVVLHLAGEGLCKKNNYCTEAAYESLQDQHDGSRCEQN